MKKTITKISFIAIMLCVIMLAANCKKDDTTTTPPADARDVFIGNFHMLDSAWAGGMQNGINTLDIVISKNSTDVTKINILNLNNTGNIVTANVSGNLFIITNQQFGTDGNTIGGSGRLENNKLYYEYDINNGTFIKVIRGQGTKFTK